MVNPRGVGEFLFIRLPCFETMTHCSVPAALANQQPAWQLLAILLVGTPSFWNSLGFP
jgi:hypothetical protein